ncbi:hypothetical protein [Geobacillus sp. 47C-IIb]|nr:hypothetical protein [Geobacillus sp. 47C-IIb]QNU30555.1 hypothetical protein IC804_14095 [Geobacillus sp. 47C-IIb]
MTRWNNERKQHRRLASKQRSRRFILGSAVFSLTSALVYTISFSLT